MTEGIGEATLTMNSPWNGVILDAIDGDNRSCNDGSLNEGVRVVGKDFNSDRGLTNDRRTCKSILGGFMKKEWCAPDVQPSN